MSAAPADLCRPVLPLPGVDAVLRPFRPADAAALARHANERLIWQNMRDRFPHPYTLADSQRYIDFATSPAAEQELALCIEVEGEAAGSISLLFKHDISRRAAETGYWLGWAHWGRGIATAAVRALTDYGFAQVDLTRIYALVFSSNEASARVLSKAGFELEGRLRQAVTKDGCTQDGLLFAAIKPA